MGIISDIRGDIEQEANLLLEKYRDTLMLKALSLTAGDEHAAEELVLQTFEAHLFKREKYDPSKGELLPWLIGIMHNIHGKSRRDRAMRSVTYLSPEELEVLSEIRTYSTATDEVIEANSDAEVVRNAIAQLPENARSALMLHYFESLSIRQIAEVMRKSPGSVKGSLHYARKVLAKRLGKMMGRAALAIAALIFGGSLLYAAAVFTGFAPSPFAAAEPAPEPAAEQPLEALGSLESLENPAPLEAPETNAVPLQAELTTTNLTTNNEETTMNSSTNSLVEANTTVASAVRSAAVKMMAAGAMLAAAATPVASALAALPLGYYEAEYLQSTGTQYINTGFYVSGQMRIEADFAFTDTTTQQQGVFASQEDQSPSENYLSVAAYVNGSTKYAWAWKDGAGQWCSTLVDVTTARKYLILDGGANTATLTDVATGVTEYSIAPGDPGYSSSNFDVSHSKTTRKPLTIFARMASTGQISQYGKLKLYSLKIISGGEVVRSYVPCVRASDSAAGLYELVEGRFLANAGTGVFTAGPYKKLTAELSADCTTVTADFSISDHARTLYFAYGLADGGAETSSWDRVVSLGAVAAGVTNLVAAVPAGFGYERPSSRLLMEDYGQFGLVSGLVTANLPVQARVGGGLANVLFAASPRMRRLYYAWGDEGGGAGSTNGWDGAALVAEVPAGVSLLRGVSVPAKGKCARFMLAYSELSTTDYAHKDDLIVQLDAIENAGRGVHRSALTNWFNLAKSQEIPPYASQTQSGSQKALGNPPCNGGGVGSPVYGEKGVVLQNTFFQAQVSGLAAALANKALTVQVFMNPDSYALWQGVFQIGNGTSNRELILDCRKEQTQTVVGSFGALQYAANSWSESARIPDAAIRDYFGQDVLATVTVDADGAHLWYDNESSNVFTNAGSNVAPTTDWLTLAAYINGLVYPMTMRAVRIYGRTLTADEIAANYRLDHARFLGGETPYCAVSDVVEVGHSGFAVYIH